MWDLWGFPCFHTPSSLHIITADPTVGLQYPWGIDGCLGHATEVSRTRHRIHRHKTEEHSGHILESSEEQGDVHNGSNPSLHTHISIMVCNNHGLYPDARGTFYPLATQSDKIMVERLAAIFSHSIEPSHQF